MLLTSAIFVLTNRQEDGKIRNVPRNTETRCNNDIKKRRIKRQLILCCLHNQIIHLVVAHPQKFTSLCKLFISILLGLFLIRILHFDNGICGDEIFYHFCSQSSIRLTVNISRCSCTMDKLDTDVQNILSVCQKHKLQPEMETGRLERQFLFSTSQMSSSFVSFQKK